MKSFISKAKRNRSFPIFGNIKKIPLALKTKVYIDNQNILSFDFDYEALKEQFSDWGLDWKKYGLFKRKHIEVIPLLTYLIQDHEARLNILEFNTV